MSNTNFESCALDTNGGLKPASTITWFNDAGDNVPIVESSGEGERRREVEFYFMYLIFIPTISSKTSHQTQPNHIHFTLSISNHYPSTTTQVERPTYMQSTTNIQVKGAAVCTPPSQHLHIQ